MQDKPLILIVNDDGITAPGIRNLVEAVKDMGEIIVVAPDSPQSGMGHAVTIGKPIRLNKSDEFKAWNIEAYSCSGTPVDCVKIAQDVILERKPDLCLSGINHGSNVAINVIYSGTMSAAMDAAISNIPSVGFSLMDFNYDADFSVAKEVVQKVTTYMIEEKLPEYFLLNVNIPKVSKENFKGLKFCRQADTYWDERFEVRKDPFDKEYYWMTGSLESREDKKDTDVHALNEGYASVVPIAIDFTQYEYLKQLKENTNFKE